MKADIEIALSLINLYQYWRNNQLIEDIKQNRQYWTEWLKITIITD